MQNEDAEWIKKGLPLTDDDGIDGDPRAYSWWALTTKEIFKLHPSLAVDKARQKEMETISGFSSEDWHQGYCLLRMFWRMGTRQGSDTNKPQDKPCVTPSFLTEEEKTFKYGVMIILKLLAENFQQELRFQAILSNFLSIY